MSQSTFVHCRLLFTWFICTLFFRVFRFARFVVVEMLKFKFKIKRSTPLHRIYSQCTVDPYVFIRYYRVKSIDLVEELKKKNDEKEQQKKSQHKKKFNIIIKFRSFNENRVRFENGRVCSEKMFVKFFLYMRFGRQSTKNSTLLVCSLRSYSRLRLYNNWTDYLAARLASIQLAIPTTVRQVNRRTTHSQRRPCIGEWMRYGTANECTEQHGNFLQARIWY